MQMIPNLQTGELNRSQFTNDDAITQRAIANCDRACHYRYMARVIRPTGRQISPDTPPPGQTPKTEAQQLNAPRVRRLLGCFFVTVKALIAIAM